MIPLTTSLPDCTQLPASDLGLVASLVSSLVSCSPLPSLLFLKPQTACFQKCETPASGFCFLLTNESYSQTLATAGKRKGPPEEYSTTVGSRSFTSAHSLGVAVSGHGGLGGKCSSQVLQGPSMPLPSYPFHFLTLHSPSVPRVSVSVFSLSPLPTTTVFMESRAQVVMCLGPREPCNSLLRQDAACGSWVCLLGGIKDTFDFQLSSVHLHTGILIVVGGTTKFGHLHVLCPLHFWRSQPLAVVEPLARKAHIHHSKVWPIEGSRHTPLAHVLSHLSQ